jgi:hypothetical protein
MANLYRRSLHVEEMAVSGLHFVVGYIAVLVPEDCPMFESHSYIHKSLNVDSVHLGIDTTL